MRRAVLAAVFAVGLLGCVQPVLVADVLKMQAGDPVSSWRALVLHTEATIGVYEYEARKAHDKMMWMSVLAVASASGSAAVTGLVANDHLPQGQRPGWAGLSISLATLSAMFAVLPHAHQYALKEAGYSAQANHTRERLFDLTLRCDEILARGQDEFAVGACLGDLRTLLAEALTFGPGSPCKPPTGADLSNWVSRTQALESP